MHTPIAKKIREIIAIACLMLLQSTGLWSNNADALGNYLSLLVTKGNIHDPSGELTNLILFLDALSPGARENDLEQLQPAWYADLDWSVENTMANASRIVSNNLLARVREYRYSSACVPQDCVPYKNYWIAAMGGHLEQKRLQQLPAFHSNDWGILSGFDFVLADWLTLGFMGGYTHTDLEWDHLKGDNSVHNFYIGPYFAWNRCGWIFDASLLFGTQRFHTNRDMKFGFVNRKVRNTHYGDSILCHAGLAKNYTCGFFEFSPYLMADYVFVHATGIKEKCRGRKKDCECSHEDTCISALNLRIKSHNAQFFQGEAGVSLTGNFDCSTATVAPTVYVGYQNITPIPDRNNELKASLIKQPGCFTVKTTKEPIYQWTTGLFVNFYVQDWPEMSLSYDGVWGDKRREYCYTAELDWSF